MRIQCPNCQLGLEIVPDTTSKEVRCPSCGSQLDLSGTNETVSYRAESRRTIGHFELLEQVGQGHFGSVWRARDTALQRIVAVKIPRTADLSPADKELFLREARTAAKLRHPNIVPVHEVGNDGDTIFIVSDFIPGITLAEQLRLGVPTFQQSAQWCATVADALDYAHENGVIHRDMKPGNVMLEKDKPYVLDFGLAKHEASDFTITTEGEILGTPAYMSPEQARGDSGSADRRCDVYSLGTVLYQMITGRKPFQGGTRALMHQILHDEPTAPRKIKKEIPRDLETVCLRSMAKEPGRRYATAKELADDLRRYLAGEPIRARPVRWLERSWRWAKRNPALSISSGIAAMAILVLSIVIALSIPAGPLTRAVQFEFKRREAVDPLSTPVEAGPATVVFWHLNPETGDPDLQNPVQRTGTSPLSVRLVPGDYLVVVDLKENGFHEVYRHVPDEDEGVPRNNFSHFIWQKTDKGLIVLPTIVVPPVAVKNGMASFKGSPVSSIGSSELTEAKRHMRNVNAFLVDPREVTYGEFKRIKPQWVPAELAERPPPDDEPISMVDHNFATAFAEFIGKRLLDEVEYEAAATHYGTTKFPWGDRASELKAWTFSAAETERIDRLETNPPVVNLFSNVAEWTSSWAVPYPDIAALGLKNPAAGRERIVRGGSSSVLKRQPDSKEWSQGASLRLMRIQQERQPGLGFRCGRSERPRLAPEQFSTIKE